MRIDVHHHIDGPVVLRVEDSPSALAWRARLETFMAQTLEKLNIMADQLAGLTAAVDDLTAAVSAETAAITNETAAITAQTDTITAGVAEIEALVTQIGSATDQAALDALTAKIKDQTAAITGATTAISTSTDSVTTSAKALGDAVGSSPATARHAQPRRQRRRTRYGGRVLHRRRHRFRGFGRLSVLDPEWQPARWRLHGFRRRPDRDSGHGGVVHRDHPSA